MATRLAGKVGELGPFWLLSDGSELPVFSFALNDDISGFDVFHVSKELRSKGWLVPAYTFPENRQDLSVLRVVVRNGFSHDLSDHFLSDLSAAVKYLSSLAAPLPPEPAGYHH